MGEPYEMRPGTGQFFENPSACICQTSEGMRKDPQVLQDHRKGGVRKSKGKLLRSKKVDKRKKSYISVEENAINQPDIEEQEGGDARAEEKYVNKLKTGGDGVDQELFELSGAQFEDYVDGSKVEDTDIEENPWLSD
jgi:hypothetical protein